MLVSRAAVLVVAVGVALAPASAFAAGDHHGHSGSHHRHSSHQAHGAHHSVVLRRHYASKLLKSQRREVAEISREVHSLKLSRRQNERLRTAVKRGLELTRLQRELRHAHGRPALRRVERHIRRDRAVVAARVDVVRTIGAVDSLRDVTRWWQANVAKAEAACGNGEDEETWVMQDFDTAITQLENAQASLRRDLNGLLRSAAGDDPKQLRAEVTKVRVDFGYVALDLAKVGRALRALEAHG